MKMKIFFSLKVAMGYFRLLKTLRVFFFFFLKSKCPKNQNQNISFGVEPTQAKSCTLATQWRVPAHMGTHESYSFVSDHAMISVLWPFPDVLLPLLDGRLQGLQEGTVQPGLWTPLWIRGAHTTVPMGTTAAWGGLFMFPNSEIFHFEMLNVTLSSQKSTSFYWFLIFFEAFCLWQKATFCIENSNFSY